MPFFCERHVWTCFCLSTTCPDFTLFALMPMFGYKGEGIKENTPILDLTLVAAYLFGPISRFHLSCLVFIYLFILDISWLCSQIHGILGKHTKNQKRRNVSNNVRAGPFVS